MPGPLRELTVAVADAQRTLNQRLAAEVRAIKTGESWAPAFALVGLAFAYGVLHAAGPGHGKVVVSTYFLARRARWREGLGLAAAGSALQAVTAILLVGVLAAIVDLGASAVLRQTQWLEIVGYALMTALGGWMLWRVARGRDACGHDHSHKHGHEHGHRHDHSCDHRHGHSHAAPGSRRDFVAAAFAVGIRPCTGALLVLLFALANGIFSIGALATVAMAVGSFLTVAALGSGAIGLRKLVDRWGDRRGALVQRWLGGAGALAVFGVGALLLTASLTQDVTGLGGLAG